MILLDMCSQLENSTPQILVEISHEKKIQINFTIFNDFVGYEGTRKSGSWY